MMTFNHMLLGGWSWLVMLIWFVFLVIGAIALIKWVFSRPEDYLKKCINGQGPLGILKERYARGEIAKKEFEEKKKDLI